MKALLAMRGYDKKKHLEAYSQDCLKVPLGDLKLQGTLQKWRQAIGQGSIWNTSFNSMGLHAMGNFNPYPDGISIKPGAPVNPGLKSEDEQDDKTGVPVNPGQLVSISRDASGGIDHPPSPPLPLTDANTDGVQVKANIHATLQLKDVICPKCGRGKKVGDSRLLTKTGFSNLRCKNETCGDITNSAQWMCRCNVLWIKCPRHVHIPKASQTRPKRGEPSLKAQRLATFGVDKPLPTFKHLRRTTGERDRTSHQQPLPAGYIYSYPDGPNCNQYPDGLMGKQKMSQKAGSEACLINERGCSNALSVDLISAPSEDVGPSDSRTVSRARLGKKDFYEKPELYHNRWRQQFVSKFPNSKLARSLF